MAGPSWKLEDDKKTVTVTFPTDPVSVFKLDTRGVEAFLKNLGDFRIDMEPEIPTAFPIGQKVNPTFDPRWYCEAEPMEGNSLLCIRDPRFGWFHYLLPKHEAKKLGSLLIQQAENDPPVASSSQRH